MSSSPMKLAVGEGDAVSIRGSNAEFGSFGGGAPTVPAPGSKPNSFGSTPSSSRTSGRGNASGTCGSSPSACIRESSAKFTTAARSAVSGVAESTAARAIPAGAMVHAASARASSERRSGRDGMLPPGAPRGSIVVGSHDTDGLARRLHNIAGDPPRGSIQIRARGGVIG
jgi:hypothetical protein